MWVHFDCFSHYKITCKSTKDPKMRSIFSNDTITHIPYYFIWEKCKSRADENFSPFFFLSFIFILLFRFLGYKDIIIACRREISLKNSLLCLFIQLEIFSNTKKIYKKYYKFHSSLLRFYSFRIFVKWSWHLYASHEWKNQTAWKESNTQKHKE